MIGLLLYLVLVLVASWTKLTLLASDERSDRLIARVSDVSGVFGCVLMIQIGLRL